MKSRDDILKAGVMIYSNPVGHMAGFDSGRVRLSTGVECDVAFGRNEDGWEHVSVKLFARRLPTWDEMCEVKDIFWDAEEEVVQMHPKKSEYINFVEALHLWRPTDGNWSRMNRNDTEYLQTLKYADMPTLQPATKTR